MMAEQEHTVSSFSATGNILLEGWIWDSSAEILIAGTRDPFRIKLEITHSWGKPLLHILIRDDRLEVLEFGERKFYTGEFSAESLSRFLPVGYYDKETIWAMLRGYPEMLTYHDIQMTSPSRINLVNLLGNTVKVIEYSPENLELKFVSLPGHPQELSFSDFRKSGDIDYASEVRLENITRGRPLILRRKKASFNREIPDEFFSIEKPSAFETVYFDDIN